MLINRLLRYINSISTSCLITPQAKHFNQVIGSAEHLRECLQLEGLPAEILLRLKHRGWISSFHGKLIHIL